MVTRSPVFFFFFFNDTATTEIYTLSLHDALPIWRREGSHVHRFRTCASFRGRKRREEARSEEHTSELQSQSNLVCRLLLEKKKKTTPTNTRQHRLPCECQQSASWRQP